MTKPLRILLLEDSESDAKLIQNELERSGTFAETKRVDSESAFRVAVAEFAPDVVLSDHSLSSFDAPSALTILRSQRPTTPFIVVTGSLKVDNAIECIRAGAEDVILKENLWRLAASVTSALSARRPLDKLTSRQIEVLALVTQGKRTRDIANRLNVSVKTVESHRGEIMKRLEIHDVVSLVHFAVRVGLVTLVQ
jgi:DNA-binding NarL/FixJ family response regulator